jgi:hypothetical protein
MEEVGEGMQREERFASDVQVHGHVIYFQCVRGMPEISQACAGGAQQHTAIAEECCWLTSNPNFLSLPATVLPSPSQDNEFVNLLYVCTV